MFLSTARLSLLGYAGLLTMVAACWPLQQSQAQESDSEGVPHTHTLPFDPRERLVYNVRWGIFHVGRSTLETLPMGEVDGVPAYRFVMRVTTNDFADAFYKLRERMDTWIATDFSKSLRYTKQAKGSDERDEIITFDWEQGKVFSMRDGNVREPLAIEPGRIFDPLGTLYAFRFAGGAFSAEPGDSFEMRSCDGRKIVAVDVEVHKRQTLRTPAGKFETVKAEPNTKDLGGVFKKSDDANIIIWYTDDERRIPVRLKSKVAVGAFTATLRSIETRSESDEPLVDFPDPATRVYNWDYDLGPVPAGEAP